MSKKILIVEDDEDIGKNLEELLVDEGYSVDITPNGNLALEYLESSSTPPDLILLDLMMPVMNGMQFREIQKNYDKFSNIPVVVMTANRDIEGKKSEIEALDFIKKPFELDSLLSSIEKHLH